MAAVSLTVDEFIAGIVIAILASSVISVGASMIMAAGPEDQKGHTRPQGPQGACSEGILF